MKNKKYIWSLAFLGILGTGVVAWPAINLKGTYSPWSLAANASVSATYESSPSQASIEVTGTGTSTWRIDIQMSSSYWNSNLYLYARRTSDGQGNGTISGGTSYLEIVNAPQTLFTASRNRTNIDIQFKLTLDESAVADTYSATIIYTAMQLN